MTKGIAPATGAPKHTVFPIPPIRSLTGPRTVVAAPEEVSIDACTIDPLREKIKEAISSNPDGYTVVDFTNTTYIDSRGFGLMLGAARRAREAGSDALMIITRPHSQRVFQITGFNQSVRAFPSLEAIDNAIADGDDPITTVRRTAKIAVDKATTGLN